MTLAVAAALLLAQPAAAALSAAGRGTASGQFLKLGAGARAAGMGEAQAAVADDPAALFWNPAGLARDSAAAASLTHAPYLDGSYFDHAAVMLPAGSGKAALGFQQFSYGTIEQTDAANATLGTFSPRDLALSLGYAKSFDWGAAGAAVKYVRSTILHTAKTEAVDLGYQSPGLLDERLRLGAALSNIGGRLRYDGDSAPLPLAARGGLSWKAGAMLLALDGIFPNDDRPYAAMGLEAGLQAGEQTKVLVRAGLNSRSWGQVDGASWFSFGAGLAWSRAAFDYALVPVGGLGLSHRLTLGWRFSGREDGAPQASRPAAKAPESDPDSRLDEAEGLVGLDAFDQARAQLELAGSLLRANDPRKVRYLDLLGSVELGKKDVPAARNAFMEAAGLVRSMEVTGPSAADAYAGLGYCLLEEGKTAYAVKFLKRALTAGPSPSTRRKVEGRLRKLGDDTP